MSAVLKLPNLTSDESAVLREIVQLRALVARLQGELNHERALRQGAAVEMAGLRLLRAQVLDAAIENGFSETLQ